MRLSTWAKNNGVDHDPAAVTAHASMILDREVSMGSNLEAEEVELLDEYELPEVEDPDEELLDEEELEPAELLDEDDEPVEDIKKLPAGERIRRGLTQAVVKEFTVSCSSSAIKSGVVEATDAPAAIAEFCRRNAIKRPSNYRFRVTPVE